MSATHELTVCADVALHIFVEGMVDYLRSAPLFCISDGTSNRAYTAPRVLKVFLATEATFSLFA